MQLAESMESNHAATVWTVKLKQGVTWHDGTPFTADDVIYTFKHILSPANAAKYGSAAGNVPMIDPNGLTKVNDHELTLHLKTPWIDLPSAVGQRFVSIIKMAPLGRIPSRTRTALARSSSRAGRLARSTPTLRTRTISSLGSRTSTR